MLAPAGAAIVVARLPVPGASRDGLRAGSPDHGREGAQRLRAAPARRSSFQGADVGADVLLQDGRRLWVFGDTLRAPDFDGQRFVRNSMLVFGADVLGDGAARRPRRADPRPLPGDVGYWPMSIARVQRTATTSSGWRPSGCGRPARRTGFAFETLGPAMAVFVVCAARRRSCSPSRTSVRTRSTPPGPCGARPPRSTAGGSTSTAPRGPKAKGIFGFSLHVARTRPDDLLRHRPVAVLGRTHLAGLGLEGEGAHPRGRRRLADAERVPAGQPLVRGQQARRVPRERPRRVDRPVPDRAVRPRHDRGRTCPRTPRPASCATCRWPTRT